MSFLLRLLRIRYIIFGTAVGGGYAARKKYQDMKDAIPDLSWMKEYLPEETVDNLTKSLADLANSISLPDTSGLHDKVSSVQQRFNQYLLTLSTKTDEENKNQSESSDALFAWKKSFENVQSMSGEQIRIAQGSQLNREKSEEKTHEEMMNIQMNYQQEISRLEKEIRAVKRQILLQHDRNQSTRKYRKIPKSLIDMYSEVLDELNDYDINYNVQDHLPRVVVIGDQSSGKTSVLEMITKARIFPRGAGEMMTRSPVKVTLSEGPYHVAMFKDSPREFDLTKEDDLMALRKEIELRMKSSVRNGQTISSEVISLTVKGPGLQRMVLVDLPGIISTETIGMAADTKNSITRLANNYMANPNAIILCIQDGSVDAERSNVTDLVSKMDPHGKRTIFVLTKVDVAETNLHDKDRIRKILDGKLFPMKALGYFAVVTGRGNAEDPIDSIQQYEEDFFQNSKLFHDGAFKSTQTRTKNLSLAVSDCFWKMVKESVEQQADSFKARRFNLETEWKNNFPKIREQNRDELFERVRGEILDEVVNLSLIPSRRWEENISKSLWENISNLIFDEIFIKAFQIESIGDFNTFVDVKLEEFAQKQFPQRSVALGHKVLLDEFQNFLEGTGKNSNSDPIGNDLKFSIVDALRTRHNWDEKALDSLRVIQSQALQDRNIDNQQQWENATKFLDKILREELKKEEEKLNPNENRSFFSFLSTKTETIEQQNRSHVAKQLNKIFLMRQQLEFQMKKSKFRSTLDFDELTTVRKNLQANRIDVSNDFINEIWTKIHKIEFLKQNITNCSECRRFFHFYQQNFVDQTIDCREVVLFSRLKRMIEITSNAIRQQISNIETHRLEREVREILDEFSTDENLKCSLLKGKRVELAEDLKRVRQIQEKLEEFIVALNREN